MIERISKKIWPYLDVAFWSLYLICFYKFIPVILHSEPATGGDTGSHLWPVVALREYGLPHLNLRPWNPGNYAGEPLLVHYFPLPFVMMALASYVMPLGLAFNIGTFLPVLALPPAMWWCARKLGRTFGAVSSQIPLFSSAAGIFALGGLLNHGNTMWGGNIYSDLSGQFAHQYALVLLFLFLSVLPDAFLQRRSIYGPSLLFAAVVLSHAYVALFLPVLFLGILTTFDGATLRAKALKLFQIGFLGSLLSAWFWWPLIDNAKWTTPFSMTWVFGNWISEVLPVTLAPALLVFAFGFIVLCFLPRYMSRSLSGIGFCLIPMTFAFASFKYFDRIGLVDVRALPQMHYFMAFGAAWILSAIARCQAKTMGIIAYATIIALAAIQYRLVKDELNIVQDWVNWNYAGWSSKPSFESLKSVSEEVRGSFQDPRILFEHGEERANSAGTPRVWEMLPFFAGRSTTDGLYMQSTILAPMTFYAQAAISASPSCPFPNFECTGLNLAKALQLGDLLGVDTYILSSPESFAAAEKTAALSLRLNAPPWRVYHTRESLKNPYVLWSKSPPKIVNKHEWRAAFWKWFLSYKPGEAVLIAADGVKDTDVKVQFPAPMESCQPKVSPSFAGIELETPCPGTFHVLKFAFHDSWKADSGDKLWLVSPGYIGITPTKSKVMLKFGQSISWTLATWTSLVTFIGIAFLMAQRYATGYNFKNHFP